MNPQEDTKGGLINITVKHLSGQSCLAVLKSTPTSKLTEFICDIEKWKHSSIRIFLNGDRLKSDLTLEQNSIENLDEIDIFLEMYGGKNTKDEDILNMLHRIYSVESDESDDSEIIEKEEVSYNIE